MKEWAMEIRASYDNGDVRDIIPDDWFLSVDTCLVALRGIVEKDTNATMFDVTIVVRNHDHMNNAESVNKLKGE